MNNTTEPQNKKIENENENKRSKGWVYALIALISLALTGIGLYVMNYHGADNQPVDSSEGQYASVSKGKYCMILYDDNTGDFIAPNGGRICGVELRDQGEPLSFNLKKTITVLDHNTDRFIISGEYFFADYSDYLQLDNQYHHELVYAPVNKQEGDGMTIFTIDFADGQIENLVPKVHQIDFPEDQYTLLFYNDKSGALFGPGCKHVCGITDSYSDGIYRLSKTINLFNVSTKELAVYNNKLFKSSSDAISEKYAHAGDLSKSIADLNIMDEGDVIIYHFSVIAKQPETLSENGEGVLSSSYESSNSKTSQEESQEHPAYSQQSQRDIDRWLDGMWVHATIDTGELEIYEEVFTFRNGYYSFACGTERTFHTVGGRYQYHVKGNMIYTFADAPLLRIDKSRNRLVDVDDSEKIYIRK